MVYFIFEIYVWTAFSYSQSTAKESKFTPPVAFKGHIAVMSMIGLALFRGFCSRGLKEIRPSLRSEQREQTSWSNCHRCPTTLCHVNLSEKEARAAERCPRCHGLICEVTDSACVRLWRENKTTEKSRGRLSWPFVLQGSGSLCESDNNFKGPCLPEHLWQVCVGMCAGVKAATLKP